MDTSTEVSGECEVLCSYALRVAAVDFAAFVVAAVSWYPVRRLRGDKSLHGGSHLAEPLLTGAEADQDLIADIDRVLTDTTDVRHTALRNYLIFLWTCGELFTILSFIAVVLVVCAGIVLDLKVLVVNPLSFDMQRHPWCIWIMYGFSWIYGFLVLFFVHRFTHRAQVPSRNIQHREAIERTIWLKRLPVYEPLTRTSFWLTSDEFQRVQRDLCEAIEADYRMSTGSVLAVHVVPVVDRLSEVMRRQPVAEARHETYKALALTMLRSDRWCASFWHWYYDRLAEKWRLKAENLTRERDSMCNSTLRMSGTAFATLKKADLAADLMRIRHCHCCRSYSYFTFGRPPFASVTLTCERAPPPDDLIWENLHVGAASRRARLIFLIILLVVFMLVAITPVTIASQVVPLVKTFETLIKHHFQWLEELLKLHEEDQLFWRTIIDGTPSWVLLANNSLLLPVLIGWISLFSRQSRTSQAELIQMQLNYVFLFLNTLVLPLLGLDSIRALVYYTQSTAIGDLQQNHILLPELLISGPDGSGAFVLRYLWSCTFLTSANQLLQIPQEFLRAYFRWCAVTTKEKDDARARLPFSWGYWYAFNLSILTLAVTLSICVPLVVPIALMFFAIRYHIDKYNFHYNVWSLGSETDGWFVPTVVFGMKISVCTLWMVMACVFAAAPTHSDTFGLPLSFSGMVELTYIQFAALLLIVASVILFVHSWGKEQYDSWENRFHKSPQHSSGQITPHFEIGYGSSVIASTPHSPEYSVAETKEAYSWCRRLGVPQS